MDIYNLTEQKYLIEIRRRLRNCFDNIKSIPILANKLLSNIKNPILADYKKIDQASIEDLINLMNMIKLVKNNN